MTRDEKLELVAKILGAKHPAPKTELNYETPFQLLVATILAAQCTDKRVNLVTAALFQRYPDAKSMSELSFEALREEIKSINFLNNKAKNILDSSKALVEKYNGEVPDTLDALTALPGVGRKTAHVVMSNAFGKPVLAVDTHVHRVANRLGLANSKNVRDTENQLMEILPESLVSDFHHYLILHGRYTCKARSPQCMNCELTHICNYFHSKTND
ncbi:endonuclease III [Chloroherpeton thalassium ATCC 35110]|uniref:Endonuclease III n=1 Tax=Chloroherpeton thalassium (strain ATCC 35110 / GB-78) TaxID=517418 RepID=B3QV74_CHLT3|nr:endonuclease III [Chloroherpeton thalassium]ACF13028.1 endonuclease III [Chloroherpeton thalassium ATCC 35110]